MFKYLISFSSVLSQLNRSPASQPGKRELYPQVNASGLMAEADSMRSQGGSGSQLLKLLNVS